MKKILLGVSLCVAMCACNDIAFMNEPVQENETMLSRSGETTSAENYTVTPEMVCKYLNIARKGKTINSLTPMIENGDTLAYVAQYADTLGWDLISGDRRIAPVLAFADSGIIDISDINNPAVKAVLGMLQISRDVQNSNNTEKHSMWKSLEPKVNNNTIIPRGWGQGKWIAIDTIYNDQSEGISHIIKTKWGQDYPWNVYTPFDSIKLDPENNETYGIYHSAVGCGAVALGQLIYHYRKNNNRGITLPMEAYFTDSIVGSTPTFSNFSVNGWNNLAKNINENNTNKSALFLSYLGSQLDLDYSVVTEVQKDSIMPVMNVYKLIGNENNVYDFEKIWLSLKSSKPILMCALGPLIGHAFLIDGYRENLEEIYVNYVFDPYYEISEDELSTEDLSLFEWPEKEDPFEGIVTKRKYWNYDDRKYISMNWGWDGSSDDIYFLAYNRTLEDVEYECEGTIYSPSWLGYNNVIYYIYNIAEMP
ncbi:MAG: hypothetical protein E7080_07245 [Bacteroidales bacterium]|nr:hypothetical protein [Bacteroidales bacterium]